MKLIVIIVLFSMANTASAIKRNRCPETVNLNFSRIEHQAPVYEEILYQVKNDIEFLKSMPKIRVVLKQHKSYRYGVCIYRGTTSGGATVRSRFYTDSKRKKDTLQLYVSSKKGYLIIYVNVSDYSKDAGLVVPKKATAGIYATYQRRIETEDLMFYARIGTARKVVVR